MSQLSNSGRSRAQRLVPFGTLAAGAFLLCAAMWQAIDWGYNRVYVPEGKSLLLRYKGFPLFTTKPPAQPGHFARVDESGAPLEIGYLERMRGPGRHFYCPLWWERELVDDLVIEGGHVGIATCKMGDDLPRGEFLVDGTLGTTMQKGIFRNVLAPGCYRINPYAYSVEVIGEQVVKSGSQDKPTHRRSTPAGSTSPPVSSASSPTWRPTRSAARCPAFRTKCCSPASTRSTRRKSSSTSSAWATASPASTRTSNAKPTVRPRSTRAASRSSPMTTAALNSRRTTASTFTWISRPSGGSRPSRRPTSCENSALPTRSKPRSSSRRSKVSAATKVRGWARSSCSWAIRE